MEQKKRHDGGVDGFDGVEGLEGGGEENDLESHQPHFLSRGGNQTRRGKNKKGSLFKDGFQNHRL